MKNAILLSLLLFSSAGFSEGSKQDDHRTEFEDLDYRLDLKQDDHSRKPKSKGLLKSMLTAGGVTAAAGALLPAIDGASAEVIMTQTALFGAAGMGLGAFYHTAPLKETARDAISSPVSKTIAKETLSMTLLVGGLGLISTVGSGMPIEEAVAKGAVFAAFGMGAGLLSGTIQAIRDTHKLALEAKQQAEQCLKLFQKQEGQSKSDSDG